MFDNNIEIFSSRDKIREQIIEFAKDQLKLENFDFNKSSYLSYLINVLSALSANHIFYNSSIWKQFFLLTADQKESVLNLSTMLGYETELGYPSYASVLLSIPLTFLKSTTTQFTLYGQTNTSGKEPYVLYAKDIKFNLINDVEFKIDKLTVGETVTYTAVIKERFTHSDIVNSDNTYTVLPWKITNDSSGVPNLKVLLRIVQSYMVDPSTTQCVIPNLNQYEFFIKEFEFSDAHICNINVSSVPKSLDPVISTINTSLININPTPIIWTKYSSIPLIPSDQKGYIIRSTSRGVKIYFGNGIYGEQPRTGDLCNISLYLTDGYKGNVIPGSINKCQSIKIQDDTEWKNVQPTVINYEPSLGGKDSPTIDDIRRGAIEWVKTGQRLVTYDDYECFASVAKELPISTSTHVLKRSDLKRNEICLFTDLVYNDTVNNQSYIVPTRNHSMAIDSSSSIDGIVVVRAGTETTITSDSDITEEYVTMFNIRVDTNLLDSEYYYTANDVEVPISIARASSTETLLLPSKCVIYTSQAVNPIDDTLHLTYYYSKLTSSTLPSLSCQLETTWNGRYYELIHDPVTFSFTLDPDEYIPVITTPEGSQTLKFTIRNLEDSSEISTSFINTILVQKLDEFMYSQVNHNEITDVYTLYDVPVLKKDYWDRTDQSKFNYYIINKIIQFDVTKYRMLTDFVNFKFANTTGYLKNLSIKGTISKCWGNVDYMNLSDNNLLNLYNSCADGIRVAVCTVNNPWERPGGFIATRDTSVSAGWTFIDLIIGEGFYYELWKRYIYSGNGFVYAPSGDTDTVIANSGSVTRSRGTVVYINPTQELIDLLESTGAEGCAYAGVAIPDGEITIRGFIDTKNSTVPGIWVRTWLNDYDILYLNRCKKYLYYAAEYHYPFNETLVSAPYKGVVHLLNITSTEMTNLESIHWEDGLTIAVSTNKVVSDGGFGRWTGFIAMKDSNEPSGWVYTDLLENDIICVRNRFYYQQQSSNWVKVALPYTPRHIRNRGVVHDIKGFTGVAFVEDTLKLTVQENYMKYAVLSSKTGDSSGYGGFIATYHNDPTDITYYQQWTFGLLMYNDYFYSERQNMKYVYTGTGFMQATSINNISLINSNNEEVIPGMIDPVDYIDLPDSDITSLTATDADELRIAVTYDNNTWDFPVPYIATKDADVVDDWTFEPIYANESFYCYNDDKTYLYNGKNVTAPVTFIDNTINSSRSRGTIDYINLSESELISAETEICDGLRVIVTYNPNYFDRTGGFIATKDSTVPGNWIFENLRINDTFYCNQDNKKYVYNGNECVIPDSTIPIAIKLVVWMDTRYSGTDSSLVERIKSTLIDTLYSSFGYNKNLLVAEITRIVKSIDGVANCKVVKPSFDIIYDFDMNDLTQTELLEYTPELMYFDTTSIEIDVRI